MSIHAGLSFNTRGAPLHFGRKDWLAKAFILQNFWSMCENVAQQFRALDTYFGISREA